VLSPQTCRARVRSANCAANPDVLDSERKSSRAVCWLPSFGLLHRCFSVKHAHSTFKRVALTHPTRHTFCIHRCPEIPEFSGASVIQCALESRVCVFIRMRMFQHAPNALRCAHSKLPTVIGATTASQAMNHDICAGKIICDVHDSSKPNAVSCGRLCLFPAVSSSRPRSICGHPNEIMLLQYTRLRAGPRAGAAPARPL
jgi:hypothetical protein